MVANRPEPEVPPAKLPILASVKHLFSVDGRRRLTACNLVVGIVITALLLSAAQASPHPPLVGFSLALLIGGSLTLATIWVSLFFGGTKQPKESRREANAPNERD